MAPTTRAVSARMASQTTRSHTTQADHGELSNSESRPTKKRKQLDSRLDASFEPLPECQMTVNASYLPEDILSLIFQCLHGVVKERETILPKSQRNLKVSSKTWIYVSHVCRRWREIALNCTPLWNDITTAETPEEIETYIARSKAARICTRLSGSEPLAVQKLILQQLPRTRRLAIVCCNDHFANDESLSPLWDLPTPHLETLILFRLTRSFHPPPIVQKPHPALKTVFLIRAHTNWDSPTLRDLASLSILCIENTYRPTMSELYLILLACPNLQTLALVDAGPEESHHFQATHLNAPVIRLHCLLQLKIDMDTDDWAILLQYIDFPGITTWSINCRDVSWEDPPVVIPHQISLPIGGSMLKIVANSSATVLAQQHIDSDKESERQIRMDLSEDLGDVAYVFHVVPTAVNGTSLVNITQLYMKFIVHDDVGIERHWIEEWAHFLDALPKLEVMTVSLAECSAVDPGMALFAVLANQRTEEDSTSYAAPKLRKLELHGCGPTYHALLTQSLKSRYKFAPLQELVLAGCGPVAKTNLKALRKHVGNVQVMTKFDEVPLPRLAQEL
ncbi:hypothetical protein BD410DRAFT_458425 [Rickenella mellea]|uniref:Uncharacterized protein n=1 Tax=Rickenella mellea TaxID=50990 RepID=A0A4Y7PWG0_9AGAM|nr:hypothetical protein BD410DRAFT_458425 [Rickenella mellea]